MRKQNQGKTSHKTREREKKKEEGKIKNEIKKERKRRKIYFIIHLRGKRKRKKKITETLLNFPW